MRVFSSRHLASLLGLALTGAGTLAAQEHSQQSPTALTGKIEATQRLPGGTFSAVRIAGRPDLYFLSENGRFLIKGQAYDLWSGEELRSIDAVRAATDNVNLTGLDAIWPDLAPLPVGRGSQDVVIFVAPTCPACTQLLDQLPAFEDRYRFLLLPIPIGGDSGELVRHLACAQDPAAAAKALMDHDPRRTLPQRADCDAGPVHKRLVAAQVLQVTSVPWLIRADGRVHPGVPQDLAGWLEGDG